MTYLYRSGYPHIQELLNIVTNEYIPNISLNLNIFLCRKLKFIIIIRIRIAFIFIFQIMNVTIFARMALKLLITL